VGSAPAGPLGVRVRDFAFRYSAAATDALRDVSFELDPGEVLLVVGASGSGKSTVARAIAGVLGTGGPTRRTGEVEVGGDVGSAGRGRAGIVFQDPASQLVMDRVEDDVAFGLENLDWPLAAMQARVPDALAEAGLAGFERRRTARLSGGEQQRVALAGVLAPRPGLLVLDEPTANLDPPGSAALFDRLAEIRRRRSATVVLVEHRVEAAWPLADRVLALGSDGVPIDFGRPDEVVGRSGGRLRAEGIWLPAGIEAALGGSGGGRLGSSGYRAPVGPVLAVARDVSFGFDRRQPVLIDVDLELRAGERVALTGPNGSGKSTLGRLLAGLLRPDRGAVAIRGEPPARLSPRALAQLAGHVPQDPELAFLADTVTEEATLGLDRAAVAGVASLMARLGLPLEQFGDRSPYRLSGGEQRRLSLAPALARRPDLLVLDEPTFGLDRRAHEGLVAVLDELVEAGTCVLAATHDERLVGALATRRIALIDGRVASDGPVSA
jgi:energy-coupling factor transport system ATP-binding protein